jgi:chromosome partition protein MukB
VSWETGTGRASVEQALESVEETIDRAEGRARVQTRAADESEHREKELRDKVQILEARKIRWQALIGHAEAVREHIGVPLEDRAQLGDARTRLRDAHAQGERALSETEEQRTRLRDEARELRTAGGAFPEALLRLRDDLTADLLASHFEDVGVEVAGELEARLGPLAEALVVEDLDDATRRLVGRDAELPTVWLIQEDSALALDPDQVVGRSGAKDVVVDKGEARRVTRIPARPTLGRAAREQRAALLEKQAEDLESKVAELREEQRQGERIQQRADALLEGAETWLLGDPAHELQRARKAVEESKDAARAAREVALSAKQEAKSLRPRQAGLRALLPDAALLDEPDPEQRLHALRRDLEEASQAAHHLARVDRAPADLQRHLDALRRPPLSEADVASCREQILHLRRRRDVLAEGIEALTYVAENRAALDWSDAAPQLVAKEGLVPALTAQHDQAAAAVVRAREAEEAARRSWDAASRAVNEASGAQQVAASHRDEATHRLDQLGVPQPTETLLEQARSGKRKAIEAHKAAERRLGSLQKDLGRLEEAFSRASKRADTAMGAVDNEHRQARPALEAWDKLRPQIEAAGLLEATLSERFHELSGVRGSVNLFPYAQSRRDVLLERLRTAKGAAAVLEAVQEALADSGQSFGASYLGAWLTVRDWLRTRLPAQIAEVDEPLEALDRFRDHLSGLVERLERQETELRGASEDVARGIEVQIRKAGGRVRRLNQNLDGVTFGSIRGIRVRMRRVERMEQVLQALRSGAAQELLFQPGMPVEKALEEIFRRFGGGRTGGQRLLDYREYIHLHVEVQRRSGRAWEPANPTRLSTGEAIGVGAALMMVVLTEWERDANLLRGKRAFGSMRFLFLDEANRLDQANLATVFDLCRNLDLQILVAAPEVARAEGCTVFRLVRTRSESGVEQVIVSGRRVIAGEA